MKTKRTERIHERKDGSMYPAPSVKTCQREVLLVNRYSASETDWTWSLVSYWHPLPARMAVTMALIHKTRHALTKASQDASCSEELIQKLPTRNYHTRKQSNEIICDSYDKNSENVPTRCEHVRWKNPILHVCEKFTNCPHKSKYILPTKTPTDTLRAHVRTLQPTLDKRGSLQYSIHSNPPCKNDYANNVFFKAYINAALRRASVRVTGWKKRVVMGTWSSNTTCKTGFLTNILMRRYSKIFHHRTGITTLAQTTIP